MQLDTRGLKCPLPVLRAQKKLRTMAMGAELILLANDAPTWEEVPLFCTQAGHVLVSRTRVEESTEMRFIIQRG